MDLRTFKQHISEIDAFTILDIHGKPVPAHFHMTEFGHVIKTSIDCGNTSHKEEFFVFQIWVANDVKHRLSPEKVLKIIDNSVPEVRIKNLEVQVEYQTETIGTYGLSFSEGAFKLVPKHTDCKALDACAPLVTVQNLASNCSPDSGCCN